MRLFSGDELVFIGPGSEWFWTTIGTVVTAVSLIAIFRQLRLQRSADAIKQVDAFMSEFFSERMLRYQLDVLVALRDGVDPARVPTGSAAAIANYLEKVGTLAHAGHLDMRLLGYARTIGRAWWATLAPMIQRARADAGMPMLEDFEWLAGRFAELDRREGVTVGFDDVFLASSLAGRIAIAEDMIHVEQALRTVMIAPPEAPFGASPARAAVDPSLSPDEQERAAEPPATLR